MSPPSPEPRQTCRTCGRYVVVNTAASGFPPDAAKRKLRKLCKANGHESDPQYTAGVTLAIVGEQGPELLDLAAGTTVHPQPEATDG